MKTARPLLAVAILVTSGRCASTKPSVVVPFEFLKHQIVVQTTVNGHGPYSMLLDTLVSPSVIDAQAASDAGLTIDVTKGGEAEGVGSEQVRVHAATIRALEIGGVEFGDVEAVASDMSRLASRLAHPLHGVLGYSFLRDKIVTIDYPARRLYINAERRRSGARADVQVPFNITADELITVSNAFAVNGITLPVSIDSGSSLTLDLYGPAVERLNIRAPEGAPAGSVTGARGDAVVQNVTVDSIGIGPLTVEHPEVSLSDRKDFGAGREGNVGNGFLQHYIVTIDYPARQITLQKP